MTALVAILLIIVWIVATPNNNPFSNPGPVATRDPRLNPNDVPTQADPVPQGITHVPGEVPTIDPSLITPVPTGSPPQAGVLAPLSLSNYKAMKDIAHTSPQPFRFISNKHNIVG